MQDDRTTDETMLPEEPTPHTPPSPAAPKPVGRGFANLSVEARRLISKKGGKAAQASGRGHRFSSEEARSAGRAGGYEVQRRRRKGAEKKGAGEGPRVTPTPATPEDDAPRPRAR